MFAAAEGGLPRFRDSHVRDGAGEVKGRLNCRLKAVNHELDVRLAQVGGGLLEFPKSGAVDVIDAGKVHHYSLKAAAVMAGQHAPQFLSRRVGDSPLDGNQPRRSDFLLGGAQKPDNPSFPTHLRVVASPVTRQPKRDKLTDFPTFPVLRCI